ncbi:MAG TPA: hypothetical protein V6C97_18835 [Oculatellaceae cyanobacterium]
MRRPVQIEATNKLPQQTSASSMEEDLGEKLGCYWLGEDNASVLSFKKQKLVE